MFCKNDTLNSEPNNNVGNPSTPDVTRWQRGHQADFPNPRPSIPIFGSLIDPYSVAQHGYSRL